MIRVVKINLQEIMRLKSVKISHCVKVEDATTEKGSFAVAVTFFKSFKGYFYRRNIEGKKVDISVRATCSSSDI